MVPHRAGVCRLTLATLLLCLPVFLSLGCGGSADEQFDRLVDDFIQGYFAAYPVTATSIGAHEFDPALNDMSQEAIDAEIQRLHGFKDRIEAFPGHRLDRDDRIDLSILSSLEDFARRKSDWDRLAATETREGMFRGYDWNVLWLKHMAEK